ncbi:MAG: hemolysin family protein [Phycisphaerae bacterium]
MLTLAIFIGIFSMLVSLVLTTCTFAFRDFSRARLEEVLENRGRSALYDPIVKHEAELAFLTSAGRMVANFVILLCVLHVMGGFDWPEAAIIAASLAAAVVITLVVGVALPHALSDHAGEKVIGLFAVPLNLIRIVGSPLTKLLHVSDHVVRKAANGHNEDEEEAREEEFEQDILDVVEEGREEGIIDEHERRLIERVMAFDDRDAGQVMTARPNVTAIPVTDDLKRVRDLIIQTGLSRIPAYDENLDNIVGILYARDLIEYVGEEVSTFDVKKIMRPPIFIPETKPLRDLLQEMRIRKVHMAIVLDEYGGTAGLVTIEDVLEELVGEISDEHEPQTPAMLKHISESAVEADARIPVEDLNHMVSLELPEDEDYDTLGGFVSTTTGQIPQAGTSFTWKNAKFTVVAAEPHRVNRVRIDLIKDEASADEALADSESPAAGRPSEPSAS